MSDAISRFDAQKLVYDYCHARTVEGRQLKSPAVFTTHTGTDLAEAIGRLPAVQPDAAAIREAALQDALKQVELNAWTYLGKDDYSQGMAAGAHRQSEADCRAIMDLLNAPTGKEVDDER